MSLLCPHCLCPVESVPAGGEVACSACGSSFRLDTAGSTGPFAAGGRGSVGRFELLEVVGLGAFGTVYKARDPQLDRVVALKLPRAGNLPDPAGLDRFLREARSAAQLRHPAIVPVHEVGQADGLPYLVSEFVAGVTLADRLTARRPAFREAAGWLAAVAGALDYAHRQGVVHRDIKPSNVMFDADGAVRVMDFGLAKRDAGEVTMTAEGQVLGTPAYMSPEQARGEGHTVDGRSDVYSLGVILYELLTGELPFRGNARMLLHQVLHDDPRPPRKVNDRIPRDLETVCLKAMAREPARRYPTAAALADDLGRWLRNEPVTARPPSAWYRLRKFAARNRAPVGGVAATFLALVLGIVGVSVALARAEREAANARAAEGERRAELAHTAAAAARLAAQRGQWREALAHYETALSLGHEDEVGLRLGVLDCCEALYDFSRLRAELAALTGRADLGPYEGRVLLQRAIAALWFQGDGDPLALARQALDRGLPPADAAYARLFFATTTPEAIGHLQEALRHDPFHPHTPNVLASLLFVTGRIPEMREAVLRARLVRPDSLGTLQSEVFLYAIDGDRAAVERALARLEARGGAELIPPLRATADVLAFAQSEDLFWTGLPPDKQQALAATFSTIGLRVARITGGPEGRPVSDLPFFGLPLFQKLREQQVVQELAAASPLSALALLAQPGKLADILAAVTRANPEGTCFLTEGVMLERVGRLTEAEAAFRQATVTPAWSNCRRPSLYRLADVQAALFRDVKAPAGDRLAWRQKALDTLHGLSDSGPLPGPQLRHLIVLANNLGDYPLALALLDQARRQTPEDAWVWKHRYIIEDNAGSLDRSAEGLAGWRRLAPDDPEVAKAQAHLDGAMQTNWPLRLAKARHRELLERARRGEPAAADEAERLAAAHPADGPTLYAAACALALASAAARRDAKLPEADRARLAEGYAARAVAVLARTRGTDHFQQHLGLLLVLPPDDDLAAVRDRADFRRVSQTSGVFRKLPATIPALPE